MAHTPEEEEYLDALKQWLEGEQLVVVKPKDQDDGKAHNQAEDDFTMIKPTDLVREGDDFVVPKDKIPKRWRKYSKESTFYPGVPYWNDLTSDENDADGNVKEKPKPLPRFGECECGAEKTYGKNAPHSTWCAKYRSWK